MGIRKTLVLTSAATLFAVSLSASALAEAFTFSSTSEPGDGVVLQLPDGVVTAGSLSGTSNVTWASGTESTNAFKCHSMTQPPSGTFDLTGLCAVTDGDIGTGDTYTILFGCNFLNDEGTASNCWGGLFGQTGSLTGKTGTMSWNSQDGASTGTGQWN